MKAVNKHAVKMVEKRSVSASEDLFAEADKMAAARRMSNFSEYIRDLIRRDLATSELNEAKGEAA